MGCGAQQCYQQRRIKYLMYHKIYTAKSKWHTLPFTYDILDFSLNLWITDNRHFLFQLEVFIKPCYIGLGQQIGQVSVLIQLRLSLIEHLENKMWPMRMLCSDMQNACYNTSIASIFKSRNIFCSFLSEYLYIRIKI